MTIPAVRNDIQVDGDGSAAICEEIADRLRIRLTVGSNQLPRQMMMLVDQMAAGQRCVRPNDEVTK
jgi:hypothetical protein